MQPAAPHSDARHTTNRDVAQFLEQIATLLEAKGESPFRVRAYREAAAHIEAMSQRLVDLWKDGALQTIPGVGPSIATKVDEWLRTGHSDYLDELRRSVPVGIEQLMSVPGIGPVRARSLIERLNVHTPEELAVAAENHQLRELPGFGARSEERVLVEARRWSQRERRLLLGVAWPIAERVIDLLRTNPIFSQVSAAGSLRRMRETIGDIDLLAASSAPPAAVDAFTRLPIIREVLAQGPTKASVLLDSGLQVDLRVVEPESWGAALQYFTGSKLHNITLRDIAIGMGLKVNEYGVYRESSGRRVGGDTEEDVYRALGMDWMPPELREDRGEIQAAEVHRLPVLVERGDLTGDLHVHSNWSDGTASIEAMAVAARDVGLDYIAITDHSPSLSIANGLTPERLQQQRHEIDSLNDRLAPFHIYQGSEVDIRPDGTLDLPDFVLSQLDYVSVSIHGRFHMGREEMTRRIIRAIKNPLVNTLNHPTGRLIDRRPGYNVDLEAVLRVAASQRVAIEINSQIQRLDLDDVWARRAKDLGCQMVVNSDAHGPAHYDVLRYGVSVARRGWLSSANVVNTLPRRAFDNWLLTRRGRRAA